MRLILEARDAGSDAYDKSESEMESIVGKSFIKTNFDLCTGCSICQLVCSRRLTGGYNPRRAVLKIRHGHENLYHMPEVCNQCDNAYCQNVCPVGAIHLDEATGARVVDREKCIGCGMCVRYCPVEMVSLDPDDKKAVKCDLCGGDPQCVRACPTGALEWIEREEENA